MWLKDFEVGMKKKLFVKVGLKEIEIAIYILYSR